MLGLDGDAVSWVPEDIGGWALQAAELIAASPARGPAPPRTD